MTLTPRHEWFRNRVQECLKAIKELNDNQDWEGYMQEAVSLANELHYAATEWKSYYGENIREQAAKRACDMLESQE